MKIAIIGTRGIPNNYGGFEQLAQYLSLGLKENGHDVYVYSSHRHSFREKQWKGINIIHQFDPEKNIGTMGQFVYDLNCILNTRKHNFNVILNLGYTSSSIWMKFFPSKSRIITNMDGLEWKRSKYNKAVQRFLSFAEGLAVRSSDILVADSLAIQKYLLLKYNVQSEFIAYGAPLFTNPDNNILTRFNVKEKGYNLLIARMEPENNIEMILDGMAMSSTSNPFLVIGNYKNKFGSYLKEKFANNPFIVFTGPIYDEAVINSLRFFSNLYFHGHSVGGTNPSLLEAMGCSSLIAAHHNEFNKSVLGEDALFFNDANEVAGIISNNVSDELRKVFVARNFEKIKVQYSWPRIVGQYEAIMTGK